MSDKINPLVSLGETTKIRDTACPECHELFTHASGQSNPQPGDVTICLYCGAVLTFDDQVVPVRPAADELAELLADPEIQRVLELREIATRRPARG